MVALPCSSEQSILGSSTAVRAQDNEHQLSSNTACYVHLHTSLHQISAVNKIVTFAMSFETSTFLLLRRFDAN